MGPVTQSCLARRGAKAALLQLSLFPRSSCFLRLEGRLSSSPFLSRSLPGLGELPSDPASFPQATGAAPGQAASEGPLGADPAAQDPPRPTPFRVRSGAATWPPGKLSALPRKERGGGSVRAAGLRSGLQPPLGRAGKLRPDPRATFPGRTVCGAVLRPQAPGLQKSRARCSLGRGAASGTRGRPKLRGSCVPRGLSPPPRTSARSHPAHLAHTPPTRRSLPPSPLPESSSAPTGRPAAGRPLGAPGRPLGPRPLPPAGRAALGARGARRRGGKGAHSRRRTRQPKLSDTRGAPPPAAAPPTAAACRGRGRRTECFVRARPGTLPGGGSRAESPPPPLPPGGPGRPRWGEPG